MLNKLYVDLIGPYKIHRKVKDPLILKVANMIDLVNRWFKLSQYNDKKLMMIENLVKTMWLTR